MPHIQKKKKGIFLHEIMVPVSEQKINGAVRIVGCTAYRNAL